MIQFDYIIFFKWVDEKTTHQLEKVCKSQIGKQNLCVESVHPAKIKCNVITQMYTVQQARWQVVVLDFFFSPILGEIIQLH